MHNESTTGTGAIESSEPHFITITDEFAIQIPALPRPTLEDLLMVFPRVVDPWIDHIQKDTSFTKATTLRLTTVLYEWCEDEIGGHGEYDRRLAKLDILLGYQQAVWLVEHQDEFPQFTAFLGKIIHFSGLVVVSRDYGWRVPYLHESDLRLVLGWYPLNFGFSKNCRIAVSGK